MRPAAANRQAGGALALALVVVVVAGALGAALLHQGTAAAVEASKQLTWAQAFWSAEAGLEQARAVAHKRRLAGAREVFPLSEPRSWTGATSRGHYQVSVEEVTMDPPGYRVVSEGYSPGGARAAVEAMLRQTNALSVGLFGADGLALQPNQTIASDPPGLASIGSNVRVDLQNNLALDGTIILGADTNGLPAACDTNRFSGYDCSYVGWIEPDPLGARGGALALEFAAAALVNDNSAVSAIRNGSLTINRNQTVALPPGTYYLNAINCSGHLLVTNGPVRIFLTGGLDIDGSRSGVQVEGASGNLRIYSNSSTAITVTPNSEFRGLLYAPYADITIQPNNLIEGLVWGATVDLQPQNNATILIDTALLDYYAFSNLYRVAVTWRSLPRMW